MPNFDFASILYQISIWAIPVMFAITVHEVAHGWVAKQCGDMTAARAGRLTLNPIKHVDPLGTIVVPAVMIWFAGLPFGWAKPVPVVPHQLNSPRRDMLLVAIAGPGVNMLMALGWALFFVGIARVEQLIDLESSPLSDQSINWLIANCTRGIVINVTLAIFNMLPIPPLDGGRVLASMVPPRFAIYLNKFELLGIPIVLALWFFGLLQLILEPPIRYFIDIFEMVRAFAII